jgi:hypothetical protein
VTRCEAVRREKEEEIRCKSKLHCDKVRLQCDNKGGQDENRKLLVEDNTKQQGGNIKATGRRNKAGR